MDRTHRGSADRSGMPDPCLAPAAGELSVLAGRLAMVLRMHSGRRSSIDPAGRVPPDSALARDAAFAARDLGRIERARCGARRPAAPERRAGRRRRRHVRRARAGGRIYDCGVDGSECRWARVLAYEAPNRLVFSWGIGLPWKVETDPEKASEVEVRFTSETPERTRVDLEHRNLDRHGTGWEGVRDGVDSEGGWPLYLQRYEDLLVS